jgi:hypothetical protein
MIAGASSCPAKGRRRRTLRPIIGLSVFPMRRVVMSSRHRRALMDSPCRSMRRCSSDRSYRTQAGHSQGRARRGGCRGHGG